jgi:hypothetical protein
VLGWKLETIISSENRISNYHHAKCDGAGAFDDLWIDQLQRVDCATNAPSGVSAEDLTQVLSYYDWVKHSIFEKQLEIILQWPNSVRPLGYLCTKSQNEI